MTSLSPAVSSAARPARLAWLDLWRGLAIVAMVIYHFAWDLSQLGYVAMDVSSHPAWSLFARSIAASFLIIAGVSLALAHAAGMRWPAFWRRLGIIAAAAMAVTVATMAVFPENFVAFGILHSIAAGSLLALPFLATPWWAAALAAAAVAAIRQLAFLPDYVIWQEEAAGGWAFRILQHLGLTAMPPDAVDFVPIFPWFAFVLIGLAGARLLLPRLAGEAPSRAPSRPEAAIHWLGRHSLPIYLVHQPILFGSLAALATFFPMLTATTPHARFVVECMQTCRQSGDEARCARSCTCVADRLAADAELNRLVLVERRADAETQVKWRHHIDACIAPP